MHGARAMMAKDRLKPMTGSQTISINRAPVLTLWAAVVAERLGLAAPLPALMPILKGYRSGSSTHRPNPCKTAIAAVSPTSD